MALQIRRYGYLHNGSHEELQAKIVTEALAKSGEVVSPSTVLKSFAISIAFHAP
jgi:hypothetical protein